MQKLVHVFNTGAGHPEFSSVGRDSQGSPSILLSIRGDGFRWIC